MIKFKKNYHEMRGLDWPYWKIGLLVYAVAASVLAVVVGFFAGVKWAVVAWSMLFVFFLIFWLVSGITAGWIHDHPDEDDT